MTRRLPKRRGSSRPRARCGFALIELLVAVLVLGVALLGVAGMLASAARSANTLSTRSVRGAIQTQQVNRLAALPYDAIDGEAGCVTVSTQPLDHSRCIAVTDVGGGTGAKEIRLIITPTNSSIRPDTTYLTRSRGLIPNPLGT